MQDTVVVIGCGPTGLISGREIDRFPVVRMWDHDWQSAERFGSRYDYGMMTTQASARAVARKPKKAWFFYNAARETEVREIEAVPVITLDHMQWYGRAQGAKPVEPRALKFTRGFAAVAGVIEHLRPHRIVAIGMDVLRNGITSSQYYDAAALAYYMQAYPETAAFADSSGFCTYRVPAGCVRNGPHDFQAEAALIRTLAAEAGTELLWGWSHDL